MQWYLEMLAKYNDISGRARRKAYWMAFLVNLGISIVLAVIGSVLGLTFGEFNLLSTVYSVIMLVPGFTLTVRRLHDTDRSGWWLLIGFIPLIGALALLYFACSEGTRGSNRYGPDPKYGEV